MLSTGKAYYYPGRFAEVVGQFEDVPLYDRTILDAANLTVEQLRLVLRRVQQKPFGGISLLVIENAADLSEVTQNALLKLLEEPPRQLVVLIAGQSQQLLPTVRSRLHALNNVNRAKVNEFGGGSVRGIKVEDLKKRLTSSGNDRERLVSSLVELLRQSREDLYQRADADSVKRCQLLNETVLALQKNVNLKLSLDNLLLNWP